MQVYAKAALYDLFFCVEKEPVDFNADTTDVPMKYALLFVLKEPEKHLVVVDTRELVTRLYAYGKYGITFAINSSKE